MAAWTLVVLIAIVAGGLAASIPVSGVLRPAPPNVSIEKSTVRPECSTCIRIRLPPSSAGHGWDWVQEELEPSAAVRVVDIESNDVLEYEGISRVLLPSGVPENGGGGDDDGEDVANSKENEWTEFVGVSEHASLHHVDVDLARGYSLRAGRRYAASIGGARVEFESGRDTRPQGYAPHSTQRCSAERVAELNTTIVAATQAVEAGLDYFLRFDCAGGVDYLVMFGRPTLERHNRVVTTLQNLNAALLSRESADVAPRFLVDCNPSQCTSRTIAYVLTNVPSPTVHICDAFWLSPNTLERDSRPGYLINVLTRLSWVAGAVSFANSLQSCRLLASSRPGEAVFNARSYQYFLEGGPENSPPYRCDRCLYQTVEVHCTARHGCGWCAATNECRSGTEDGPLSPGLACSDWQIPVTPPEDADCHRATLAPGRYDLNSSDPQELGMDGPLGSNLRCAWTVCRKPLPDLSWSQVLVQTDFIDLNAPFDRLSIYDSDRAPWMIDQQFIPLATWTGDRITQEHVVGVTVPGPCATVVLETDDGGSSAGFSLVLSNVCPPGSVIDAGACVRCPSGTWSFFPNSVGRQWCLDCPSGAYCPFGSGLPVFCPVGTYSAQVRASAPSACRACPAGRSTPTMGSTQATECTEYTCDAASLPPSSVSMMRPGDFRRLSLGPGPLSNNLECHWIFCGNASEASATDSIVVTVVRTDLEYYYDFVYVSPGSVSGGSVPFLELTGTDNLTREPFAIPYSGNETGGARCATVALVTDQSVQSRGFEITVRFGCGPGHVPTVSGACQACPAGTESGTTGGATCTACPPQAGYYCPAGSAEPVPCPGGTIYNATSLSCDFCPAGKTTTDGSMCNLCLPGFYCPANSPFPFPCPQGTYRSDLGGASAGDCTPCPAGRTTPALGSQSVDYCAYATCDAANLPPIVGGNSAGGATNLVTAAAGVRLNLTGPLGNDLLCHWIFCGPPDGPAGWTVAVRADSVDLEKGFDTLDMYAGNRTLGWFMYEWTGQVSNGSTGYSFSELACATLELDTDWSVASQGFDVWVEYVCRPGRYLLPNSTCERCPAGTYSSAAVPGLASCLACPVGSYCESGTAVPTPCPAGTFGSSDSAGSAAFCQACPSGWSSPPGSTSATQCTRRSCASATAAPGVHRVGAQAVNVTMVGPLDDNMECTGTFCGASADELSSLRFDLVFVDLQGGGDYLYAFHGFRTPDEGTGDWGIGDEDPAAPSDDGQWTGLQRSVSFLARDHCATMLLQTDGSVPSNGFQMIVSYSCGPGAVPDPVTLSCSLQVAPEPAADEGSRGPSAGAIAGGVIAILVLSAVGAFLGVRWYRQRRASGGGPRRAGRTGESAAVGHVELEEEGGVGTGAVESL